MRHMNGVGILAGIAALAALTLGITQIAQGARDGFVALPGHVANMPAGAEYIGPLAASQSIHVSMVLPLRNLEALTELTKRMYTPGDPLYGEYLTPSAFAEGYAPTQSDYDAVIAYAKSQGLTVTHQYGHRLMVNLSGTSANMEKAFGVALYQYKGQDGRLFYRNDSDPRVPAELAGKVSAVLGLDSSHIPHPDYRILGGTAAPAPGTADITPSNAYFNPSTFRNAYSLSSTNLTAAGLPANLDGSGQIVAIGEFGASFQASDFAAFVNQWSNSFASGFVAPVTAVSVNGFNTSWDYNSSGSDPELALDVDCVLDAAPGISNILVFEAGDYDTFATLFSAVLDDTTDTGTGMPPPVLSLSYGIAEDAYDSADIQAEATVLLAMESEGISVFTSSGDNAADGDFRAWEAGYLTNSGLATQDPTAQPLVTSVGGTTLSSTSPWKEQVWNWYVTNPSGYSFVKYGPVGSGGGISTVWSIPDYQSTYVSNWSSNGGSRTMRNTPDVALDADPQTGYFVYENSTWYVVGGTSASSPAWAGIAALINEERSNLKLSPVGFLNPKLYAIGASSRYSSDFHDTTTGNNIVPSVIGNTVGPLVGYKAVQGYDLATGWGSFIGANLIYDIAGPTKTTTTLATSPNPSSYGATITFTATVLPSVPDKETVTFYNGKAVLGTGTTTSSVAKFTTSQLAVGSYSIMATYAGDAADTASTSKAITQAVSKAPTSLSISSSPNPSTFNSPVSLNATITPSVQDGEIVTFYNGSSAIGTAKTYNSSATLQISSLSVGSRSLTASYPGDSNYLSCKSNPVTQNVIKIATTTSLASSSNPSYYGQAVTFTATITPSVPNKETVTFYNGKTLLGTETTTNSIATLKLSMLGAGSYTITATYAGDADNTASLGSETQTVNPETTTTTLKSSANPSIGGNSVTFTATISPTVPDKETVTFSVNGSPIGAILTSKSSATLATNALGVGSDSITATYRGDANYATSTSTVLTQNVSVSPFTGTYTGTNTYSWKVTGGRDKGQKSSGTFTFTLTIAANGSLSGTDSANDTGSGTIDASGNINAVVVYNGSAGTETGSGVLKLNTKTHVLSGTVNATFVDTNGDTGTQVNNFLLTQQ